MGRVVLAAVLFGVCVATPMAVAQDERPQRPAAQERGEVDPARLAGLIERRLDQVERQQARLREIKQRLADGESPAAIFAELRERGETALLGEWGRGSDREGPRGPREGGEQRRFEDVTDEEFTLWRNKVMAFFDRHAPEMAERLREEANSEQSRHAVMRLHREVDRLIELRDTQSDEFRPALARLRNGVRIADVLGKVREAVAGGGLTPELLRTLRRDLTEVVGQQYDAQLEQRAEWLGRMRTRLDVAFEKLERERAERSQRIEAEVDAMIARASDPESEGPPEGAGPPVGGARRGPR
jgi:hypothetical protein